MPQAGLLHDATASDRLRLSRSAEERRAGRPGCQGWAEEESGRVRLHMMGLPSGWKWWLDLSNQRGGGEVEQRNKTCCPLQMYFPSRLTQAQGGSGAHSLYKHTSIYCNLLL